MSHPNTVKTFINYCMKKSSHSDVVIWATGYCFSENVAPKQDLASVRQVERYFERKWQSHYKEARTIVMQKIP